MKRSFSTKILCIIMAIAMLAAMMPTTLHAAQWGISLDVSELYTFPDEKKEYFKKDALKVTVRNTGDNATGTLEVTLSGIDADSFTASLSPRTIAVGSTSTLSVSPKDGLAIGFYTATVTVGNENTGYQSFDVEFTVVDRPETDYGLIFDVADGRFYYDTNISSGTSYTKGSEYTLQNEAWKWNGAARTLSLTNFTRGETTAPTALTVINGSITILLDGDNGFVTANEYDVASSRGIYVVNNSLTVMGTGTLEAEADDYGIYATGDINLTDGAVTAIATQSNSEGIYAGHNINISGGEVKATATELLSNGLHADNGSLNISDGTVNIEGGNRGISTNRINITGGSVAATGGNYGLYASDAFNLSNGGVTVTAKANSTGHGLYTGNRIMISGGTLVAEADGRAIDSKMVTVSGGMLTTTGGNYGLYASDSFNISGGVMTATATKNFFSYGLYADGSIDISGGIVSASSNYRAISVGTSGVLDVSAYPYTWWASTSVNNPGGTGTKPPSYFENSSTYKYVRIEAPATVRLPVSNSGYSAEVPYDGMAYLEEINGLFHIDPDAGARTYKIKGGTGEGILLANGALLVTKLGTFEIGLTTAVTSTYEAGAEVIGTLTVTKGSQMAPTGLNKVDASVNGASDGKIMGLGIGKTYEYKKIGEATYTAVTPGATEIQGLAAGSYVVRFPANDLYNASPDSGEIEIAQPLPVHNIRGTAEVTYAGSTFHLANITGLFTMDSNAGTPTYTIEPGGTGVCTLSGTNNHILSVTKAGTFHIGLTTAATTVNDTSYMPGDKIIATLTVNKGMQSAPTGIVSVNVSAYGLSNGKITGLNPDKAYEYKKYGESAYVPVTPGAIDITGLAAGEYALRFAANDLYKAGVDMGPIVIGQPNQPTSTKTPAPLPAHTPTPTPTKTPTPTNKSTAPPASVDVTDVKMPQKTLSLVKNQKLTMPALAYTKTGKKAKLTWTVDKPSVASVTSKGVIKGLAVGKAKITAAAPNGKKFTLKVNVVKAAKAVKSVAIKGVPKTKTMKAKGQRFLTVTVNPVTATGNVVKWKSNKPGVVKIDAAGKIIASKPGKAKITAKVGKKKASVTITVK